MGQLIGAGIMFLLSLLGLFLASRAQDAMFGFFGFMLFVFGVAALFVMIHKATEPRHHQDA